MIVHLIEPRGRGGVFQHAVAIAAAISNEVSVCIHTATDTEVEPPVGVEFYHCVRGYRTAPTWIRPWVVASAFLIRTTPHLVATLRGQVAHVQGAAREPLNLGGVFAARTAGSRFVFKPHNMFSRGGNRVSRLVLRHAVRMADATIVFSEADAVAVRLLGGRPYVAPLLQLVPDADPAAISAWRERWRGDDRKVVLFAGQLRPDKRLDLAIAAVAQLGTEAMLAVVGDDQGGTWSTVEEAALSTALGVAVAWDIGFHPSGDFVAAIAAADVVVCPYDRASQSGVTAGARAVGTPSVATAVAGLAEQADDVCRPGDAAALADAVRRALERGRRHGEGPRSLDAAEVHLAAYGSCRGSRRLPSATAP